MAKYNHKTYYWLRLDRNFFKRHDIKIIEGMPNGYEYIVFYMKLLCESIDHDGALRFNDIIPYDEKMLSLVTGHNVDIVRSALSVFLKFQMIEIWDDDTLFMKQTQNMIGSQTEGAYKKQLQRQNLKVDKKVDNCPPELEIDKEIDKEINNLTNYSFLNNGEEKNYDVENFVEKYQDATVVTVNVTIDEVQDYILSTGREVNVNELWQKTKGLSFYKGKPIYDWKGLVDKWGESEISAPYLY